MQDAIRENNVELAAVELKEVGAMKLGAAGGLLVYNGRMGNRAGSDDGWNFRGRGAVQTTGRDGYRRLAATTGLDVVTHPNLVNDPAHFLKCGGADFVNCGCLPFARKDDVRGVTKRLNGGYVGLRDREAWLSRWKRSLGSY